VTDKNFPIVFTEGVVHLECGSLLLPCAEVEGKLAHTNGIVLKVHLISDLSGFGLEL
jgi:hypothetical protein